MKISQRKSRKAFVLAVLVVSCSDNNNIKSGGNDYDANYGDESDPGPYPIPLTAPIVGNGSGDSHVLAIKFIKIQNEKTCYTFSFSGINIHAFVERSGKTSTR